ncbi:MAG: DUF695 domain-containing protein [Flavipsychrobacter sp.]|nr:DUF695 domain-containing protein [Flavipsychrobacter sp.]
MKNTFVLLLAFTFLSCSDVTPRDYNEGKKDIWTIVEEKNEGMIVRIKDRYLDCDSCSAYPVRMGVAIPVIEHNTETSNLKDSIESYIEKMFAENNSGIFVAVQSGLNGEKFIEFISYAKADNDFESIHETLKKTFPTTDVQMYAEIDPEWKVYKSFLKK